MFEGIDDTLVGSDGSKLCPTMPGSDGANAAAVTPADANFVAVPNTVPTVGCNNGTANVFHKDAGVGIKLNRERNPGIFWSFHHRLYLKKWCNINGFTEKEVKWHRC